MKQLCPEVIVESKQNNSELVKAVRALEDIENRYIIVFDNSFDNLQLVESLQQDNFDYKGIREIVEYDKKIEEHNIEQLIVCKVIIRFDKKYGI